MTAERTDEEIVTLVQGGDEESFGVLIDRFEGKIRRYARKFLSHPDNITDLVQDVFIKAYENIQSFDTERRFSPWLYRIAHNEFVNALKKSKNHPTISFDADTFFPHPTAPERTEDEAVFRELSEDLERALDALDPKYREPLVLYYFEEMSYQEIADILHIPIATVGVRLRRGREALKKICKHI